ncbi:MAG: hypothetical protein V2I43_10365, partial [Parvularcula sp.]|nr:hypothetical protein [Parvularcula sp.]
MTTPPPPLPEGALERRRQRSLSAIFYFAGLFVLGGFVLWIGQGVLVPIVIAAFLCFLIVTVKRRIERVPYIGPLLPEGVQFALAFALIILVLMVLLIIVRENIEEVVAAAPGYNTKLREIVSEITQFSLGVPFLAENLEVALDNIQATAIGTVQSIF